MRIWDINPGYLNRQSLLGEHQELHAVVVIIRDGKKGFSHHPETLRWVGHGWALQKRHRLLVAEMALRGYHHRSPVRSIGNLSVWPEEYVDTPAEQFHILKQRYKLLHRQPGRIPFPKNAQQLWAQHKYSVMARDYEEYKSIGHIVAGLPPRANYDELMDEVCLLLKQVPDERNMRNTLQHMCGYVSKPLKEEKLDIDSLSNSALLIKIQKEANAQQSKYLLHSTALSNLAAWCDE